MPVGLLQNMGILVKELEIDLNLIYQSNNEQDVLEYVKQKYYDYVKGKGNQNPNLKIVNEVYSIIRKNPNALFMYAMREQTNTQNTKNNTPQSPPPEQKNNHKHPNDYQVIRDYVVASNGNELYDEIIVPMTLPQIYRNTKHIIKLKDGDQLVFRVSPSTYDNIIHTVSNYNRFYIVRVKVNDDKWYLDEHKNLVTKIRLPLYDCMLGCITSVEYIDQTIIKVEVPAETYDRIVLPEMGWPIHQKKRSNLIIKIDVIFPKNISEYERRIIKTLQDIEKVKPIV